MRALPILVALGTLVAISPAFGQRPYARGYYGGYDGYHSSTAAEGAARGAADVVRSAGMKNLLDSEAAINVETARSKYFDNRMKWTKTYFEMKRYNKEYRDSVKKPRPTSEQLFRLAKEATPKRLTAAELDPVTGSINWPEVLKMDNYASYRDNLESLYADLISAGGKITMDQYKEIERNIDDLQLELKQQIDNMPPQVFTQANRFIKRLKYKAKTAF